MLKRLEELLAEATAGDPISGLKWTHQSLRKLAWALARQGYTLSPPTLSRLLRQQNYSLKVNHKRMAGQQAEGRDKQFRYIVRQRQAFARQHWPVISGDAKKKELIGNFKQPGTEWRRKRREVNLYDFASDAAGKAIPYGIYDLARNEGYVSVGVTHETPQFAVAAIRWWWRSYGRKFYPGAARLLMLADCGGGNGNRCRVWKAGLEDFARESGLRITVTHYPTGASKWNPIEHRMFNLISANWAGHPLESYETVLKHLRTTQSSTDFCCKARLDKRSYDIAVKVSPQEAACIRLRPHQLFPHWNYTIYPHT